VTCFACSNEARYTTAGGLRACGLCSIGDVSIRDRDIPELLKLVDQLCKYDDRVPDSIIDVVSHSAVAQRSLKLQLRSMIGRVGTR